MSKVEQHFANSLSSTPYCLDIYVMRCIMSSKTSKPNLQSIFQTSQISIELKGSLPPRSTSATYGSAKHPGPRILASGLWTQQTYRAWPTPILPRAISKGEAIFLPRTRRILDRWHAPDQSKIEPWIRRAVSDSHKGQIDDLQSLSREYERQETIRMSRSGGQRDPYINEPIPVGRRTSPDYGSYRNSR